VRFDRYSPYFMRAAEYGLQLRHLDYYGLTYPFDDDALSRLAYYFTDMNYRAPYVQVMLQWLGRIREQAASWHAAWNGGQFESAPRLWLQRRNGSGLVHDSRGGRMVEHAVSDDQIRLLERLELPLTLSALREAHGPTLDADLAALDALGLVWTEGDRSLSLVLPGEY